MSVVEGKRLDTSQGSNHERLISITKITRNEKTTVCMGKQKGLLQVLWDYRFTDTFNNICTYYILRII